MAGVSQAARVGVVVGRTLATTSCDADVIDYVAGIVAQVLSEGTATPQVLVDAVGPVLVRPLLLHARDRVVSHIMRPFPRHRRDLR